MRIFQAGRFDFQKNRVAAKGSIFPAKFNLGLGAFR
jgi:hypothetical protein